jgi:hypothetical protein
MQFTGILDVYTILQLSSLTPTITTAATINPSVNPRRDTRAQAVVPSAVTLVVRTACRWKAVLPEKCSLTTCSEAPDR